MTKHLGLVAIVVGLYVIGASPAIAAACDFESQGEGRVAVAIDGRTFRLDDAREVRLAGIESVTPDAAALGALIAGRDVTLRAEADTPDRWGRQSAFVFVAGTDVSVQMQLLEQ